MLKRFFRGSPPKYEVLPMYVEGSIAENLPSYEELFTGRINHKKGVSPATVISKDHTSVAKAIERLTSGKIDYLRLDKTTVSPMSVLEYFVEHGASSHKDVYLFRVLTEPNTLEKFSINGESQIFGKQDKQQHTFYLISHKAILDTFFNFSKITNEFCYRSISLTNNWAVATNFLAFGNEERQKSINYISSLV